VVENNRICSPSQSVIETYGINEGQSVIETYGINEGQRKSISGSSNQ
jgi:hypothetical protein